MLLQSAFVVALIMSCDDDCCCCCCLDVLVEVAEEAVAAAV